VFSRHGVAPMDATEPTYVATTIFQDRSSYEKWQSTTTKPDMALQRSPETVYYEGTLVISSGKLFSIFETFFCSCFSRYFLM
jgi:hypothetical protein